MASDESLGDIAIRVSSLPAEFQQNTAKDTVGDLNEVHKVKSNKKKHYLNAGDRGFLVTCGSQTKNCVRECYNILTFYGNALYGPELPSGSSRKKALKKLRKKNKHQKYTSPPSFKRTSLKTEIPEKLEGSDEEDFENSSSPEVTVTKDLDIMDEVSEEIGVYHELTNAGRCRRFQAVDTGVKNCIFIKTTLSDPTELVAKIYFELSRRQTKEVKYIQKFLPIEVSCYAKLPEIVKASRPLLKVHFSAEPKTFAIVFNKRLNNVIHRGEVIDAIAKEVVAMNAMHKVNLGNPELTIVFEIVRGKCLMSVLECYQKFKKYNISLLELVSPRASKRKVPEVAQSIKNNTTTAPSSKKSKDGDGKPSDTPNDNEKE